MQSSEKNSTFSPHVIRSLVAVIIGSLLLRAAAGAMGQNIQFYFNSIHQAAIQPDSPLRALFGSHHVYRISYTLGGIIIGSFFAAELIGSIFFGAWSDRYGRKLFIIFGPLFGAIAVQITALTTILWLLVVTRLLEGLSTASNAPATLGYIAEASAHSPKLRTRVVGFFQVATIGGTALGFTLGGWLWKSYGAPAVFLGIQLTSPRIRPQCPGLSRQPGDPVVGYPRNPRNKGLSPGDDFDEGYVETVLENCQQPPGGRFCSSVDCDKRRVGNLDQPDCPHSHR
jgi:MFS family permease